MEDAVSLEAMHDTHDPRATFRRGFLLMLPLWAGAIPSGLVYGLAAQHAGLTAVESQLMSLTVFSAAGQISAVALIAAGTAAWVIVVTVLALNAQLLLISLAVGRQIKASPGSRFVAGWFLTDGAYGVSAAAGLLRLPVLLGAGVSMYAGWNLGTLLGLLAGNAIPDPERIGISLVIPLSFLAVLVPLLRSRPAVAAALASGITALLLGQYAPLGVAVLVAGATGCTVGAVMSQAWHQP